MPNHHILLVYGNHFILFRFIILRFYVFFFSLFLLTILERYIKKNRARTYFYFIINKESCYVCVKITYSFYFSLFISIYIYLSYFILINHYQSDTFFLLNIRFSFFFFQFCPRVKRMETQFSLICTTENDRCNKFCFNLHDKS